MSKIQFSINSKHFTIDCEKIPVNLTLNRFIREHASLFGTKYMCLEGGCGACICILIGHHPVTKDLIIKAANSCLTLINSCDGFEILTIEGVGNRQKGYHPIQERLAKLNGTQCGFCTPGFVMNMFALLESNDGQLTLNDIENSFGGNLCRCTGYRPILDAMKSFANNNEYNFIDICADIEDISLNKKNCPKTGLKCSNECTKNINNQIIKLIDTNNLEWYTVNKIIDIIKIFNEINNKKYILIGGNTAYGVYRTPNDIEIFIDINKISELHSYEFDDTKLIISSNVNLTEAMEIFLKASKQYEYCNQLYKHFQLIAHVPIRNVGTLAGNIMIKHQHNEFPSDIFLLFETLNVKMIIMDYMEQTQIIGLMDFLKLDMNKKIITKFIFPNYSSDKFIFDSYKIMPRSQNAHAIVNAAFLIQFNDNDQKTVKNARICFGGIKSDFLHAVQTENFLINKNIYDDNVVANTIRTLNREIQPDWILPDLSPEYRRLLACSLYYKFLLSHAATKSVTDKYKSGGDSFTREISHGTQSFETIKKDFPLRQPINKLEAQIQTAGEAFYVNDLPHHPNELWCAFVMAKNIGSKIVKIDPEEALELPGVVAFYSARDIPGKNSFVRKDEVFNFVVDEEIFCSSEVLYYDQPLGIIVAKSTEIAEKAAKFVKVMYEKPIKKPELCFNVEDVLKSNQLHRIHNCPENRKINPNKNKKPEENEDVSTDTTDDSLKILRQKFQGYLKLGNQYYFTMEPHTTICKPSDFGIEVYSSTQWMDLTQDVIARSIGLKQADIQLIVNRIGGGFGSKISRCNQVACACALACHKLNVPVRFVQSIESMMRCVGKRNALYCDYNGEIEWNGKITNLEITFYSEAGCTLNDSPVEPFLLPAWKNCYSSFGNKWVINPNSVITDTPSHSYMRAPGTLEAISMIENVMEHIARKTKRDSVDVRLVNIDPSNKMKKLLQEFVQNIDYTSRKNNNKTFNKENRWRKRGLGVSVMEFPISYYYMFPASVVIYHDGTVAISHGGVEIGQGLNTKAAQVAAYILGIPLEFVKVLPSNTFNGANTFTTGASITSESICYAVKQCCETLNERLKPIRAKLTANAAWPVVSNAAYMANTNLLANSIEKVGDLKSYPVYGLACSEVEVDILTGNIILHRVDILEDTGESLSPWIDIGQIEGGFIQGLGYWLTEELISNRKTGELLTDRTWNYKIPGAKDIPIDFRINLLQKTPNPNGFLKSKATGEPAICLAISAVFGIRRALNSAQKDAGNTKEWYHLGAPTTTETILLNSGTSVDQFIL